MGLLDWLFGKEPYARPPPEPFPTREDAQAARAYKEKFGNPNEQMIRGEQPLYPDDERQPYRRGPPGLLSEVIPSRMLPGRKTDEVTTGLLGPQQPLDMATADALYAAQIAAQRSPMGLLGYDVSRISPTSADDTDAQLTHSGLYNPKTDRMWADMRAPSSAVHESMHRAFKQLYANGAKKPKFIEEYLVRALMLRHHGDIEKGAGKEGDRQVEQARDELQNNPEFVAVLDEFERLANEEIARRNMARGPL